MIDRQLSSTIRKIREGYPALYLGGPRQAGKTTLLRNVFSDLPYVTLEEPDIRLFAETDPRAFLARFPDGAVLDEVQRVPLLFNYLQTVLDEDKGFFALSGSQNYLMMEGITQSLAGRVAVLTLHPFALNEQVDANSVDVHEAMYRGGYPRRVIADLDPEIFFDGYVNTYLERDVRSLRQVGSLGAFKRFVRLCAARTGQLLNLSNLASDADVSVNTVKDWISILEASYLIFRLEPYYRNFNKRIGKTPKLYFFDTGLVCYLLGIDNSIALRDSYLYGQIAETYLVSERVKKFTNQGRRPRLSFWRESNRHEIDLLEEMGAEFPHAFELKGGQTLREDWFKELDYWRLTTEASVDSTSVVYCGDQEINSKDGNVIGWRAWLLS